MLVVDLWGKFPAPIYIFLSTATGLLDVVSFNIHLMKVGMRTLSGRHLTLIRLVSNPRVLLDCHIIQLSIT